MYQNMCVLFCSDMQIQQTSCRGLDLDCLNYEIYQCVFCDRQKNTHGSTCMGIELLLILRIKPLVLETKVEEQVNAKGQEKLTLSKSAIRKPIHL